MPLQAVRKILDEKGYEIHVAQSGEDAVALIKKFTFSVVVASFRTNERISGLDILTQHELVTPGKGKILLTHDFSKRLILIANFIGALCVPESISSEELVGRIESFTRADNH